MAAACESFLLSCVTFRPRVPRMSSASSASIINPNQSFWRITKVNRKLIRTTLAEVKGKARETPAPRERANGHQQHRGGGSEGGGSHREHREHRTQQPAASSVQVRKRTPPPMETSAEIFYYKKQIDA